MSVRRIASLISIPPIHRDGVARPAPPGPGDTLLLTLRVLANEPARELQVDRLPLVLDDYPAMRLDQAELRTIVWGTPSATSLAMAWQLGASQRSVFPVYVWSAQQRGGLKMLLRHIDLDEDEAPPRTPRRGRRSRCVQLELSHPQLGHILVDVQWRLGGLQIALEVEPASAQSVRAAIPAVVAALTKANLRLVRVRLIPARARAARPRTDTLSVTDLDARASFDHRMFRAAAETVIALLNPRNPRC